MCACKYSQIIYKKHEYSLFTPLISKHDYDKSKVENINYLLQCEGWKTSKAPVV